MAAECPGCGAPTTMYDLRRHDGAHVQHESAPAWCGDCLRRKIEETRDSLDPCRCGAYPEPHRHNHAP